MGSALPVPPSKSAHNQPATPTPLTRQGGRLQVIIVLILLAGAELGLGGGEGDRAAAEQGAPVCGARRNTCHGSLHRGHAPSLEAAGSRRSAHLAAAAALLVEALHLAGAPLLCVQLLPQGPVLRLQARDLHLRLRRMLLQRRQARHRVRGAGRRHRQRHARGGRRLQLLQPRRPLLHLAAILGHGGLRQAWREGQSWLLS